MWPLLYLPKGIIRYEKLDYNTADVSGLFMEMASQDFTGYLEIVSPVQRGFFGWHGGRLYTAFYDGDDGLELSREDVFRHFIVKQKRNAETVINVTELDPNLAVATGVLAAKPPLYRELETSFLDMPRLFETLGVKRFVGVLRFYHVRSHTRLGNILIKMNKITRDQLQQAVRLQLSRQGALRLGDALVQIGAIEPKDLGSALDLQSHARKGSDIELALAVFYEGEFLGGYTHIHKQFNTQREEILPQLVGTEVLMDILEGGLPEPMDLETLLKSPAPAPAASAPASPPPAVKAPPLPPLPETFSRPAEINPFADDGFNLRAEDLILDLHPPAALAEDDFITMSESGDGEEPLPEPPAAETYPEEPAASAPETSPVYLDVWPSEVTAAEDDALREAVQSGPEVTSWESGAAPPASAADGMARAGASAITPESRGVAYVLEVARDYLGPLGKSLLKKEAAPLPLLGRDWPENQVRELVLRFFRSAVWIVGRARSERLLEKIRERIEA